MSKLYILVLNKIRPWYCAWAMCAPKQISPPNDSHRIGCLRGHKRSEVRFHPAYMYIYTTVPPIWWRVEWCEVHIKPHAQNGLCQDCAFKQLSLVRSSGQSFKRRASFTYLCWTKWGFGVVPDAMRALKQLSQPTSLKPKRDLHSLYITINLKP